MTHEPLKNDITFCDFVIFRIFSTFFFCLNQKYGKQQSEEDKCGNNSIYKNISQ